MAERPSGYLDDMRVVASDLPGAMNRETAESWLRQADATVAEFSMSCDCCAA